MLSPRTLKKIGEENMPMNLSDKQLNTLKALDLRTSYFIGEGALRNWLDELFEGNQQEVEEFVKLFKALNIGWNDR